MSRADEIKQTVGTILNAFREGEKLDITNADQLARFAELKVTMENAGLALVIGTLSDIASIAESLRTLAEASKPSPLIKQD